MRTMVQFIDEEMQQRQQHAKDSVALSPREEEEDELARVLSVMRDKEQRIYCRWTTLNELEGLWRKILLDWMTFVVDHCHLQRQSVAAAAYYLDVCMSKGLVVSREEHQLAAACALQLSLKLFDSTVIRIEKLCKLGRGAFTEADVASMEYKLLEAMKWQAHPPSTYCFLYQYEALIPSRVPQATREMMTEITSVVANLTVADHRYNRYPHSVLSYAAMLMAMELLNATEFSVDCRQCFVLRMSRVAGLESHNGLVLQAFEDLKKTLDASPKLEDLVTSLSTARQSAAAARRRTPSSSSTSISIKDMHGSSPRHVMERLGSQSSSSSPSQSNPIPADSTE